MATSMTHGCALRIAVVAGLLVTGLAAPALSRPARPARIASRLQGTRPAETFFGFDQGEERRYRLGPPDALAPGESAEWTIRFVGFRDTEEGPVAEMQFTHRRFELIPGTWNPAEQIMEVRVTGSALLTRDGFPVRVELQEDFVKEGERLAEDSRRRVTFTYLPQAREYRKDLKVGGRDWDFEFAPPTRGDVDLGARRGLFLYAPSSLGCLGTSQSTCLSGALAFSNPGFLAMVLPYLLERESGERELMFFAPASIGADPFRPAMSSEWLPRERGDRRSQRRYFERWKLKLGASREVDVGPRTMHAWELEMGGGIDRIWMEPGGRVLRVDLETTMQNPDRRYIRLVFPFEDFVSPNDDPADDCCR